MKHVKLFEAFVNEAKAVIQETPDHKAYLDFKEWAAKNSADVKARLNGIKDGSKFFIELRNIWVDWANENAKEWSKTFGDPVSKKDFGRALASMLKSDDVIIKNSGNKITDLK